MLTFTYIYNGILLNDVCIVGEKEVSYRCCKHKIPLRDPEKWGQVNECINDLDKGRWIAVQTIQTLCSLIHMQVQASYNFATLGRKRLSFVILIPLSLIITNLKFSLFWAILFVQWIVWPPPYLLSSRILVQVISANSVCLVCKNAFYADIIYLVINYMTFWGMVTFQFVYSQFYNCDFFALPLSLESSFISALFYSTAVLFIIHNYFAYWIKCSELFKVLTSN